MKNLLRIHLLGFPHILLGDSPAQDFPTEKVKLLFFFLILFRHVAHTRSALAGQFWGDCPEVQARHSLSTALWRLRQWLEPLQTHTSPILVLEDKQIAFNVSSKYWLDVAEFEQRINWAKQMNATAPDQAAASFTSAVGMYRGELLEGCYADWCLVERNRLHQMFLQALVHLMVYHAGRQEYTQAIALGQRIVQDDPLREDVQRELMALFALNQQPIESLLQYRRLEATLREELGIEPMPETQELIRQLMLNHPFIPTTLKVLGAQVTSDSRHPSVLFSSRIDVVMRHFEAARNELTQALDVLRQIRNDTS